MHMRDAALRVAIRDLTRSSLACHFLRLAFSLFFVFSAAEAWSKRWCCDYTLYLYTVLQLRRQWQSIIFCVSVERVRVFSSSTSSRRSSNLLVLYGYRTVHSTQ